LASNAAVIQSILPFPATDTTSKRAARSPRRRRPRKILRCVDDSPALALVDTGQSAAEVRVAPVTHLDEDDRGVFVHHEIDLAPAAAVIALDQAQPACAQMLESALLRGAAG